MTRVRLWFGISLMVAVLCAVWALMHGARVQTDLDALLPLESRRDAVWQAADAAQRADLNAHLVALIGAPDAQSADQGAQALADVWQQSALFARVDARLTPDLDALRDSLRALDIAVLPAEQAAQLLEHPAHYFAIRARDAMNPFAESLLPLPEDWLGVSRFITQKQPHSALHLQDGWLGTHADGQHWRLLRAQVAADHDAQALLALRARSQALAQDHDLSLLISGGALFAAQARADAERESTRLSLLGASLTLALLFAVFRSARALWLLVPPFYGLVLGTLATLAFCGHIHALTLVIGTSLLGVLIDFPLHWLTPALFDRPWHPARAMRRLLPVFRISLLITAAGYLLLGVTPLPVLQQTAVFSCAALCGAFLATACLLPPRFARYRPPARRFRLPRLPRLPVLLVLILAILGNRAEHWRDDLRDWMALSPALLADAQRIAALTGIHSSGQYLLIQAHDPDLLLTRDADIIATLHAHKLAHAQGLSQWLLPLARQRALHARLHTLADDPDATAALRALGIPDATLRAALSAERRAVSLEDSLHSPWAEAWRGLYLGQIDGQYAAIVRLLHLKNPAALHDWARHAACDAQSCVRLIDTPSHLNALFTQTRNQAAWLKLASWALAWGVLVLVFGVKRGSAILLPPLAAALATLGLLGWLGITVSLFALFGVLLASAIGVDYSLYYLQSRDSARAKAATLTLAALTTALSFLLLATSQTPAVAGFGLAVTLGVAWNALLTHSFFSPRSSFFLTNKRFL